MLEKKLQFGLIGLGKMGTFHLEKLLKHPEVQLVGVYDKDESRLAQVATEHGIKPYAKPEDLFFDIDAVFIASPTRTHFELGKQALENNLHLFIEKPICDRVELAAELVKISQQKNLVLQTGFVERYRWLSLLTKVPLRSPKKPNIISTVRNSLVPSRERGMDIVTDLMIHDIELVLWLMQEPPVSISAEGASAGLTPIDIAYARLEFPSGTVAHLKANWVASARQRETQLVWNDRIVNYDLLTGNADILNIENDEPLEKQTYSFCETDSLSNQVDAFVKAVKGQNQVPVSGSDGLRALEVTEAIKQKIIEKQSQSEKLRLSPLERKFLSRYWGDYVH
ncbi:MAG: gfo/Idh/MocA family oxidoreductase [Proteobacteria bacterium]|nr:gfo/Idh/MocA family oxidoreductase [Pseudomonadota bacterium]